MAPTASVPSLATAQARRVDLHDDEQCAAVFTAVLASRTHHRPWDDSDGYEQTVAEWRYDDPAEITEKWAVEEDGDVVGVTTLWMSQHDNTDKIWAELDVRPDRRGRGAGTALVQALERRAREVGRHEILLEVYLPEGDQDAPSYEQFAATQGYVPESTDKVRILDLPIPDEVLDPLESSAKERWSHAYRLETHTDGLPEELVTGYCRVSNQLNVDAPTGAVHFEAETLTPERYRSYLDLERRQGRRRLTTVAIEKATSEVVAYTDLVLPSGAPTKVWQWGTLVDREHRGHRLGMAVKVANLRELQRAHPERKTVSTGNDATNSYMVGINVELGFRVVELARMYRKVLVEEA
jgi:GNAT superfamily N-acetyltransferase